MLLKKYREIMGKPEAHRNKWAFGLTVFFSILIFFGWTLNQGYINLGNKNSVAKNSGSSQTALAIDASKAPSPMESSKKSIMSAFDEIKKQYDNFKDSVSAVLVPFITSIEVYDREDKK